MPMHKQCRRRGHHFERVVWSMFGWIDGPLLGPEPSTRTYSRDSFRGLQCQRKACGLQVPDVLEVPPS